MKKYVCKVLATIAISLIVFSCKKENIIIPASNIEGRWKWISTMYLMPLSDSNPKTPENTGLDEILKFNRDLTWLKIRNGLNIDSGTYSTGHGSYQPYDGATTFIYDSVVYYRKGIYETGMRDYYRIFNDTMQFSNVFAGILGGISVYYIRMK